MSGKTIIIVVFIASIASALAIDIVRYKINDNIENTGSNTGLGTSPFAVNGKWRHSHANSINDAINDNYSLITTHESATDPHPNIDADNIPLDTTNFDNNLSSADSDVQTAFETLDELIASGSSSGFGTCLTSEPGSPTVGAFYCADGNNWQLATVQGTNDWGLIYTTAGWKAVMNLTTGKDIEGERCIQQIIYLQPDLIEDETDPIPALKFNSAHYPTGFTITSWSIDTDSTCTDTYGLSEYSNNGTAWTLVESKDTMTLSGVSTTETTITNPDVTAGNRLFLVPPATPSDISYLTLEVCGY